MPQEKITYRDSGCFSTLIMDYLDQKSETIHLYNRFPSIDNFETQMEEKSQNFSMKNRQVLVEVLKRQNNRIGISSKTIQNIERLSLTNTFTVVTGHQLSLFTGPLYFIYKIVSVIRLCEDLKVKYPNKNFVPVFWMASEDHDFEEISTFKTKGQSIDWEQSQKGAVGRIDTKSLDSVYKYFAAVIGDSKNANDLKSLFRRAYLGNQNLAKATQYIVNELFGEKGLVIIDGDDKQLKSLFTASIVNELCDQLACKNILKTLENFEYKVQVNPRVINLFYLGDGVRERIVLDNEKFKVNNTSLEFTREEILSLAQSNPELFSPNVVMRPLYQETVLPNLAYIGGGGEIAYWLELKQYFETSNVTFPMLVLRDSAVVLSRKQKEKLEKQGISVKDLFLKREGFEEALAKKYSEIPIDFSSYKAIVTKQFNELEKLVKQTDPSFDGAVAAQRKKQLNGLDNLENRFLKAQKIKYSDYINKALSVQEQVFPKGGLQERQLNFSDFYLEYGNAFFDQLYLNLNPLENQFKIIVL